MEQKNQKGIIKLIILIVIGLIILKFFFEFDVIDYVESDQFKYYAGGAWRLIVNIWNLLIDIVLLIWDRGKDLIIGAYNIIKSATL